MTKKSVRQAINEALALEMQRDERVVVNETARGHRTGLQGSCPPTQIGLYEHRGIPVPDPPSEAR